MIGVVDDHWPTTDVAAGTPDVAETRPLAKDEAELTEAEPENLGGDRQADDGREGQPPAAPRRRSVLPGKVAPVGSDRKPDRARGPARKGRPLKKRAASSAIARSARSPHAEAGGCSIS